MRRAIIICFTGIDGSGKTSLSRAIMKELERNGISCKYAWCRWSFGLASVFHFIIRKTFGYTSENYYVFKPLQIIFKYLIFLDLTLSIFFKVKIPSILRSCVIIDRYVYDLFADLIFWGFDLSDTNFFDRLMLTINPIPNLAFLIDAPLQVALSRKNDLSMDDAKKYQKIFYNLMEIHNFERIINSNFREARNRIFKTVMEYIRAR